MKIRLVLLLFYIAITNDLFGQSSKSYTSYLLGTNFLTVKNINRINPLLSINLGLSKHFYLESEHLKKQGYNNVKFAASFSISLDRFQETNFYKYYKSNDHIDYNRLSFNFLIDYSIIEMNWPIYTNLSITSGLTFTPLFWASSTINGDKYHQFLNPDVVNIPIGFGVQTYISEQISISANYSRWLLSDFKGDQFNILESFFNSIFIGDQHLQAIQVTMRYLILNKGRK